jgi:hypothetical protein
MECNMLAIDRGVVENKYTRCTTASPLLPPLVIPPSRSLHPVALRFPSTAVSYSPLRVHRLNTNETNTNNNPSIAPCKKIKNAEVYRNAGCAGAFPRLND